MAAYSSYSCVASSRGGAAVGEGLPCWCPKHRKPKFSDSGWPQAWTERGWICRRQESSSQFPDNKTHDELPSIAKSYKEQKIGVIVAFGSTATAIAKEATQEIPIVFIFVADPVGAGFVKSPARPETNITGLASYPDAEMHGKRLEIFKSVVPSLRRVVVLYNARTDSPATTMYIETVRKAALNLGVKIAEKPIKLASEVEQVLSSVSRDTADGIFLVCSSLFRGVKQLATLTTVPTLKLRSVKSW